MIPQFIKNFIIAHYGKELTVPRMAFMLGIDENALKMRAMRLRAQGQQVAIRQPIPPGTVRPRKHEGKIYQHIKMPNGEWRHYSEQTTSRPAKKIAQPKPKRSRTKNGRKLNKASAIYPKPMITPSTSKEASYNNNFNPDKVTIKQQTGGKYEWDAQKRGWVYRKNKAA